VGESEQYGDAEAPDDEAAAAVSPDVRRRQALRVAATPGGRGADGPPGSQAFEPWYGSGVDVAGSYSRAVWRERLAPGVWEVWVALGRRLRVDGGFTIRPAHLLRPIPGPVGAPGDEAGDEAGGGEEGPLAALDDTVHAALVELALNGLARRTDAGTWQVRPNCPISPPRRDKSYTVSHYQHLAAAAARVDDPGDDTHLTPIEGPPPGD